MPVPLLDASKYDAGGRTKEQYLKDLISSFRDYGFVRLKNHGVTSAKVKEMFGMAEQLFQLSKEEKLTFAHISDGSPQRGYSAIGVEKTASLYGKLTGRKVDPDITDAREHFDCASPFDKEFPNRWPEQLPSIQPAFEGFYLEMEQVCAKILRSLEDGLNAPPGTFTRYITTANNASELRVNHYPPTTAGVLRSGRVSRIWPHFDLGVITLLFSSSVGGLEVEDRKAPTKTTFIPIEVETETELIVNISETLQRWTNDTLPAGLHRVNIPRDLMYSEDGKEVPRRYSIAFLAKADRCAPVGTIPCFAKDESPKYESVTASEYHRRRLLQAY